MHHPEARDVGAHTLDPSTIGVDINGHALFWDFWSVFGNAEA